ncbi:hypothetical protein A2U01_0065640 [Trifolium medium]|uniref:Uncharacterized protein n=1 Tax=Trifolium medium TaxID=97028 RepID=A0A392S682_9FABA|nr:hypothetical protein [Trifolium medium]
MGHLVKPHCHQTTLVTITWGKKNILGLYNAASRMQCLTLNTSHSKALTDLIVRVCTCTTLSFTTGFNHQQQPTKVLTQRLPSPYHPYLRPGEELAISTDL